MNIHTLTVQAFRNQEVASFIFSANSILFTGANGSGKTSLLEALYLGLRGESFRGSDVDMINLQKNEAGVSLSLGKEVRQVRLFRQPLAKELSINQTKISSLAKFQNNVGVVLFEPDELRMLTGPAELRRKWLDSVIGSVSDKYPKLLSNYNRALKQRNRLLKMNVDSQDQYFVWEIKLSEFGAQIIHLRERLVDKLNETITRHYQSISGGNETIYINYPTPETNDYSSWLAQYLRTNRTHDQRLGHTTVGPHRDDLTAFRDEQPLTRTGSRGEMRSLVLALKLFEASIVENHTQNKPIILLDDVLSELDPGRRLRLLTAFTDHQVFITATEIDQAVVDNFKPQIIEL